MAGLSQENKLRDVFSPETVTTLARSLETAWPRFETDKFISRIVPALSARSFGERLDLIATALQEHLPSDFRKAVKVLLSALGPPLSTPGVTVWEAFIIMPQCAFISRNVGTEFPVGLNALYELTKRFSAENDLRTFIERDYERTMAELHRWCSDPSPHVRRLVSEGTRPRLPLAGRIVRFQKDPTPVLKLLENLRADPELYVRRSVANNLNDIAKDNPQIVIKTLKRWSKERYAGTKWIVQHAARSLIKAGHPEALAILGYTYGVSLTVSPLKLSSTKIKRGTDLTFSFTITNRERTPQRLMIDYVVHYQKSNGRTRPRVFKLRKLTLAPNTPTTISARHPMKDVSIRKIYPGPHAVELQINGTRYVKREFEVG
jgi:3-methyladenine DNA glycosylase AlkC